MAAAVPLSLYFVALRVRFYRVYLTTASGTIAALKPRRFTKTNKKDIAAVP